MTHRWIGLSEDGDTATLHRYKGELKLPKRTKKWFKDNEEHLRQGCVLDTETTGTSFENDVVLEIALLPFQYDRRDGVVVKLLESYSSHNDPGRPVPPEIVKITGITDEMVAGKSIEAERVAEIINNSIMIIAHNAEFDRPFVDRLVQESEGPEATRFDEIPHYWGCSWIHIDWESKGYTSAKLELLNLYHGFFVESHQATTDVLALLYLLTHTDETTDGTYLDELRTRMLIFEVQITALNATYAVNPMLKQRNYRWDKEAGQWRKILSIDDSEAEQEWLAKNVYEGEFKGAVRRIHPADRFKWVGK